MGGEDFGNGASENGANEWDMSGVEFAGVDRPKRLEDFFVDKPTAGAKEVADVAPDNNDIEDGAEFRVFGPEREMQRRERELSGNLYDVQYETFGHQMRAIDTVCEIMEGAIGRGRSERIGDALRDVYSANSRKAQEANELVTEYLGLKYPNGFDGSDAVAMLPTAEERAKKAEITSEEFLYNADRQGSTVLGAYDEVAHEVNRAMDGDGGMAARRINEVSEMIADFERRFARAEKEFMDEPSSDNANALRGVATGYVEDLGRIVRGFTEDAYDNFGPKIGQNIEDVLTLMMNNRRNDVEERCRAAIQYITFRADGAMPEEEIEKIKAGYQAQGIEPKKASLSSFFD